MGVKHTPYVVFPVAHHLFLPPLPCPSAFLSPISSPFPLSFSLPSFPDVEPSKSIEDTFPCKARCAPIFLLLFIITISLSQSFSLLRFVASLSSSSARPQRSETVRSRFRLFCFFLILKRAVIGIHPSVHIYETVTADDGTREPNEPDAAVFLRLLSSCIASSSGSSVASCS